MSKIPVTAAPSVERPASTDHYASRWLLASAIGLTVVSGGLLWTRQLPLGVPGEWTWARLEYSTPGLLWSILLAAISAGGFLAAIMLCERRLELASRAGVAGRLGLALAAGFLWLWSVQSAALEGVGLGKDPYVLYYRRTEGYFWQARYEATTAIGFLRDYEHLLAKEDYLHIGTHPPGLTLLYCGLIDLCRRHPGLVDVIEATEPESVAVAVQDILDSERSSGRAVSRSDGACLWLAALLTQFAAVLTLVPLYFWLRLDASRTIAWRAAAFWPLIPALSVFLPKSDLLYPVLAMTAAWLWRRGWMRGRIPSCFAAGATMCLGMLLSPAFLVPAALIAVQTLLDGLPRRASADGAKERLDVTRLATALAAALLGFLSGVAIVGALGANPFVWWRWNLHNHALFYDHNVRTWWKWLLVNPVELTLAAGAPVVAAAMCGGWRLLIGRDWRGLRRSAAPAFALVWTLLWLSGKNMGEAARLWIILMPWLTIATANATRLRAASNAAVDSSPLTQQAPAAGQLGWRLLLVLQAVAAVLTILRVDGFHFSELTMP